jgi:DNA mismatch endonuclease (patch repair protein)
LRPSKKQTSERMAAVRRDGTGPELAVRKALRSLGIRYRSNLATLPGSPDVANIRRGFVILVHGCFWHRHQSCPRATFPKTNKAFWKAKFLANRQRDLRVKMALEDKGLRVVVVWECETKMPGLVRFLRAALGTAVR